MRAIQWRVRLALLLLLVLSLPSPAVAAINLTLNVRDFQGRTNGISGASVMPLVRSVGYSGSSVLPRTELRASFFTNGIAYWTNLTVGYSYLIRIYNTYSGSSLFTNYYAPALTGEANAIDHTVRLSSFSSDGVPEEYWYRNPPGLSSNLASYLQTNSIIAGSNAVVHLSNSIVVISSTGGGGGGSTEAVTAGQNISIATNGSVFTPSITGTLTNPTTGNAATATLAGYVSGTITNDTTGTAANATASQLASYVSGNLTNRAQTYTFTNIAEMLASPATNGLVSVMGYWGSNFIGGGEFRHLTSLSGGATTNLGTVFQSASGGYWYRKKNHPRTWELEWFGVTPMNSNDPTTRRDSYREITNAVAAAGNHSTLIFPDFGIFTSRDLVFTNWNAVKWVGSGTGHGSKLVYPENTSWLAYEGPGGTGSALVRAWNAYGCTWEGIGFDTSTPVYSSGGYYVTNNAEYALEIDQYVGGGQISTANKIINCAFYSRGTNVNWTGLAISRTSAANCENFVIEGNYFRGGSHNIDLNAVGNNSVAILIGSSPNARGHIIRNTSWVSTRIGLVCSNGGFNFSGGLGDRTSFDFKLNAWAAPVEIKDFFTENGIQAFWLGSGANGGGGRTMPVVIDGYHNSHGGSQSNLALIELHGDANVVLKNSELYNEVFPLQRVFTNDPGTSAALVSDNTQYGINYSKDDWRLGVTNFGSATFLNGNDVNGGTPFTFRRNSWTYEIVDPVGQTNRELFRVNGSALQLSRTNSRVQIGNVPGAIATSHLALSANSTLATMDFGDQEIVSRMKLGGGGDGSTLLELHSTNAGQLAALLLRSDSGPDLLRLDVTPTAADIRFGGAPFRLTSSASGGSGGQTVLQVNESTATSLTTTNTGTGLTVNATNSKYMGDIQVASNLWAGLGLTVSNIAASSIVGTTAAKAQTNITVGTGLAFDGVTLSATGGGAVAWADVTGKPDVLTNGHTADVTLSNSITRLRGELRVADTARFTNGIIADGSLLTALNGTEITSGTVDGARIETQMSVTSDGSGVKLVNDSGSPGNSKYYGTDSGGTKGYHSLPSAGASSYSAEIHGTNFIADLGNGLTNLFYCTVTNHSWLRVTNVAVGQRVTFRFYTGGTTQYQLYVGQNGGNWEWATNTVHFGSGITGWLVTTNFTYTTGIGNSNNCVDAVGWAPGGGFSGYY